MIGCLVTDLTSPDTNGVRFTVVGDSTMQLGATTRFTATLAVDTAEGPALVEWMSSDSGVAEVDADGLVLGVGVGVASISARLSAPDLTVPVIRTQPIRIRYADIDLLPIDSLTGIGATQQLVTNGLDQLGAPQGTVVAQYQSSDPDVVSIDGSGRLLAVGEGLAVITATFDGKEDEEPVRVRRVASSVTIAESELVFSSLGRDTTLHVDVRDTEGELVAQPDIRWSSSDPSVVTVSADGIIRAIRIANATITARVDTLTATIPVRVGQTIAAITIQAGQGQTVAAGVPVPIQPSVIVRDASGSAIPGVTVTFSVLTGGGTLTDSVKTTDAAGLARLGNWVLGVTAGANALRVEAGNFAVLFEATGTVGTAAPAMSVITVSSDTVLSGQGATLTLTTRDANGNPLATGGRVVGFSASGGTSSGAISTAVDHGNGTYTASFTGSTAGTPLTITATLNGVAAGQAPFPRITVIPSAAAQFSAVTGDLQSAVVGTAVSVRPAVLVRDAQGNPIAGAAVSFEVGAGAGTVTGESQLTGADGIARVGSWTLGLAAGTNSLVARREAQVVSFTATGTAGAVSLSQSTITVASGSLVSGTSTTITLRARDANGNSLTSGGLSVGFSLSGGTTTGTIGSVSDHGDGSYTAAFLATGAGTASTVNGTIGGSAVTSTRPTITVVSSSIATSLTIQAGNGQAAAVGSALTVPLTVVARDAGASPVANAVVTFKTIAGGGTITDSVVATDANGVARLGSWTLGTLASANAVTAETNGHLVTFTANALPGAAVAANSDLQVSASQLAAGQAATLTVRARDQYGNQLTSGGRTVVFTVTGGSSGGVVAPTTDLGNGTYSASFTAITAGSAKTVSATLDGVPVGTTLPQISVVPGPAAIMLAVAGAGQQAAVAGAVPIAPAVEVRDSYNNPVSGVQVTFNITAGGGQVSGATQATSGSGRATVGSWLLGPVPGTNTLVASAGVLTTTFNATGLVGTASPATSTLTTTADTLLAGASATFTLRARDAAGNLLATGGAVVVISVSGSSTGAVSATTDNGDGTYSATFQAQGAGTASTVSATIGGSIITTPRPTITVRPGAIDHLTRIQGDGQSVVVGAAVSVLPRVRVLDAFENQIAGAAVTFTVTAGGGSTTGGSTTSDAAGVATIGSWTVGTTPGANVLQAEAGGKTVSFTATAVAGAASAATSLVTVGSPTVGSGATTTLTLTTRDQFGNALATGGAVVSFTRTGGTSNGTIGPVTDNNNGTYSATFSATTSGTATTIGATIGGVAVSTTLPTITVVTGAPASILATAGTNQTVTVNTAVPTAPQVRVTDAGGNPIVGLQVTFTPIGGGSVTGGTQTTNSDGRATVGSWTVSSASGTSVLRATAGALTVDVSATAVPGPISVVGSSVTVSQGTVSAGNSVTVTLTARDAFSNPITTGGATIVFSLNGGTSSGTIGTVSDQGNGTYTASFSGTTAGTATTIQATINGATVTSTLPTVTVTPGAVASLVRVAGNGQTATVSSPVAVAPQVRVIDAFNNTIAGATVTFTPVGGGTVAGGTQTSSAAGLAAVGTWTLSTVAGTSTLRASVGAITIDFTATGTPGPISATNSLVQVSAPTVRPLNNVTITVTIRDQFGNLVSAGAQSVVLSATGGLGSSIVLFGPVTNNGNGTHTATLTGVTTGTPTTLSATINTQVIGTTASIQVVP